MADFAALEDVEKILQIDISDADQIAAVEWALTEASAAVRIYTRQYIEKVEDEEITIDCEGGNRIFLPELPVLEISEVIEDEITLTDQTDYKLGEKGKLYRINSLWARGIQNVSITYSHGFDPIPDLVKSITARIASRLFQAGLKSAASEGIPGVASKSLGDYAVSYTTDASEGVLGASGARMMLLSEKDLLAYYRINGPR